MNLHNFPAYSLQDLVSHTEAQKKKLFFKVDARWETTRPHMGVILREKFPIFAESEGHNMLSVFVHMEDAIFWVDTYRTNSNVGMTIYAQSREIADKSIELMKQLIPVAPEPADTDISVRFWYLTNNGPVSVHRNIAAPTWENMNYNYAKTTKEGLNHLMVDFKPTAGGKLVLWHGQPGTGKTYALRALCQAWKPWCSSEYILDPETLLGASPGYLANMIMDSAESLDEDEAISDDDDDEPKTKKPRWKLFIMEDTGELLTENARERAGQGLSRLLNVVDGFIGQGLRVLVLITTNEEFESLHPAVSREGRCAASIKFDSLNMEEANLFLKQNGYNGSLIDKHDSKTLAELYSLIKNEQMPHDRKGAEGNSRPFGFQIAV